jgi:hypothetical protein
VVLIHCYQCSKAIQEKEPCPRCGAVPLESVEEHWDNGQLKSQGMFREGRKHGNWLGYHEDGSFRLLATYRDGEIHPNSSYSEKSKSGEAKEQGWYRDGEKRGDWVENGQPIAYPPHQLSAAPYIFFREAPPDDGARSSLQSFENALILLSMG